MSRILRPSVQVIEFARLLAPEPRRAVKHALAALREEEGDIRTLEGNLSGYYRLRVSRYRIIFRYSDDNSIEAIFIEDRRFVYELFEAKFVQKLKS
jgi:mRNA interferase RelE/StbE